MRSPGDRVQCHLPRHQIKRNNLEYFSPVTLGELKLPNRLVMATLTRSRSGRDGVPGGIVAEYYRQRASMGMLNTEGIYSSFAGQGFARQPGLVTQAQIDGWRQVTDDVHAEDGRIIARIMHAGRVANSGITDGRQSVGPSCRADRNRIQLIGSGRDLRGLHKEPKRRGEPRGFPWGATAVAISPGPRPSDKAPSTRERHDECVSSSSSPDLWPCCRP